MFSFFVGSWWSSMVSLSPQIPSYAFYHLSPEVPLYAYGPQIWQERIRACSTLSTGVLHVCSVFPLFLRNKAREEMKEKEEMKWEEKVRGGEGKEEKGLIHSSHICLDQESPMSKFNQDHEQLLPHYSLAVIAWPLQACQALLHLRTLTNAVSAAKNTSFPSVSHTDHFSIPLNCLRKTFQASPSQHLAFFMVPTEMFAGM